MDKYEKHKQLSIELNTLYRLKNTKYNDSFGKTFQKYGPISALTRMEDKWNRIETLIMADDVGTQDESLIDSLKDLSNYCKMTIIELEIKDRNRVVVNTKVSKYKVCDCEKVEFGDTDLHDGCDKCKYTNRTDKEMPCVDCIGNDVTSDICYYSEEVEPTE